MEDFRQKKIAILGLGEENIALTEYLYRHGAQNITICDQKTREELSDSLGMLAKISSLKLKLGQGYLENLQEYDILFRTPGLPYLTKEILKAKSAGVEVSSQTKLFFDYSPAPIIGVTGTKGKGTTTTLIGEILKKAGKRVFVGGNLGLPPINFLDQLKSKDLVVLELSSFQLQDLKKSPHIAVILDIRVDHLDYHAGSREYVESKRTIVEHQKPSDIAIINADYLTSFEFAAGTMAKCYFFSRRRSVDLGAYVAKDRIILRTEGGEHEIIDIKNINLRGEHNLENICAASITSFLCGASIKVIGEVVSEFKGLSHRLEFVRDLDSVKYYNDSFSTTPDTTIAAVKSFSEPITLLLGGSEKNADYSELGIAISQSSVKRIIPIGLTADRIIANIDNPRIDIEGSIKGMAEAVRLAHELAKKGEIVLLSPASASFDRFKNYKERGEIFKEEVGKL